MSNTTVGSLKQYYVKMGGNLSDVENISTIPGMIDAITALPGGGGGASSLSDLTDTAISDPEVGDVMVFDGEKWENGVVNTPKNNLFLIAHRGLATNGIPENTVAAFKNAVESGYSWIEIDVRPTKDNIYVLAHDATATLYKNGIAESVTFNTLNYNDIKDYTWDANGNYPVDTFNHALYSLKNLNVNIIVDNKASGNSFVGLIRIIKQYGMRDRCLMSLTLDESDVFLDDLKKCPDVKLRISGFNDYDKFMRISQAIPNEIYLDFHVGDASSWSILNPLALSLGLPTIVAGYNEGSASTNSYRKHSFNFAAGVMSDHHYTYKQISELVNNDINVVYSDIIMQKQIAPSDLAVTLSAQNEQSGGGYINMYSTEPSVASVKNLSRGENVSSEITPVSDGMCEIIALNGSISRSTRCIVAQKGYISIVGDIPDDASAINENAYKLSFASVTGSKIIMSIPTTYPKRYNTKGYYGDFYLMEVPEGATNFTASVDTSIANTSMYIKFFDSELNKVLSNSWSQTKNIPIASNYKYIAIGCRLGDGTTALRDGNVANENSDKVANSVTFEFT